MQPVSVASIETPESTKPALVPAATHAVEEVEAAGDVEPDEHAIHEVLEVPPFELY